MQLKQAGEKENVGSELWNSNYKFFVMYHCETDFWNVKYTSDLKHGWKYPKFDPIVKVLMQGVQTYEKFENEYAP